MSSKPAKIPKAIYNGDVNLNGFIISSAVLDDNRRIFSERSLATAFGIKGGGAYWQKKKLAGKDGSAVLPEYLSAKYLQRFITNELREKFEHAVLYTAKSGVEANGVDATIIADICDVYITAKNNGIDNARFLEVADNAYTMLKAFAKVGIIALVDEATGYQDVRMKGELEKIFLQELLLERAKKYQITFPLELYKQWFRLNGWAWKTENAQKRPGVIGKWTNEYVYDRIATGLLAELERRNPKNEKGQREFKHFQFLTDEVGEPKLREFFGGLLALAKANTSWRKYIEMVNMVYPKQGDQLSLNLVDD
ncbi:MAG: P63C domain-containing protein [Chitinophagales bacterium]|nr:P63C domain-containing protein [Chitinophagales bacterium]